MQGMVAIEMPIIGLCVSLSREALGQTEFCHSLQYTPGDGQLRQESLASGLGGM